MVSLSEVQHLTAAATTCEERRSHEATWNEKVHGVAIRIALASSTQAEYLDVASTYVQSARGASDVRQLTRVSGKRRRSTPRLLLAKHCLDESWIMQ